MAKEMVAGLNTELFGGDTRWALLFFYDITGNRVKDANNVDQEPLAGNALPTDITLDATQTQMVTDGDALYEIIDYTQSAGESKGQFVARMKLAHAARETFYVAWMRAQYANVGTTVDV